MPPIRHGRGRRTQSLSSSPSPPSSRPSLPQLSLWLQFVQLTITPAQVSSSTFRKALRPGFGTRGSKYRIYLNHFPVALGNKDPHQYDVTISPEVTSKTKNRDIMRHLTKSFADDLGNLILAYDGKKSAFAAGPLPFESKEFPVMIPEQDGMNREFKVSIKFAAKKDLNHLRLFLCGLQQDNPQETIQALDVVLRDSVSINREIIGRSLFSPGFGRGPLGDGIEFWRGFYQSLRPTQMGLSLNIDLSARAFYEETLVSDFVGKFLGRDISSPLSNEECIKVKRALRGVRVEVVHPKCCMVCYKVQAVTVQSTSELNFEDGIGAKKTVVQYFMEKYNVQLQYPHLPAIQAGNDVKPIYLPMEICRIAKGQKYGLKLNEGQVTKFLTATCQRPSARQRGIRDVQILTSKESNSLVTDQFGMHVSQLLSSIDARVLPPPPLSYNKSGLVYEVKPSVGQWNMVGLKMFKGARLRDWAIINFSRQSKQAVGRFIYGLVSVCQSKGIDIYSWPMKDMYSAKPDSIEDALKKIRFECLALLQMLFVILPEEDKGAYPRIKRVCEIDLGIVSQCFKPQHVMQMSNQYFENVAMKINVKVGGTNTVLSATLNDGLPCVTDQPTIIFGADVTHPSPGDDSSPSIAGVVASMDWPHVTRYRALVSAQPHRQEIISDLYTTSTDPKGGLIHGGLIRELLFFFYLSTGHKPCRIIFYRDGVSEGQFSEVLLNEMVMIRKACLSLQEDYMPPVTFIVVQKRHHTRFFPVNYNDRAGADKSGNILPGTVVDTKICHPTEFDFYLCSHAGIQGTSRPAHYHVLFDENKFTADELQWLTNSLCYTYQRCTRSVSVVPPVYYAHLAAFRARSYMEGDLSDSDSSSSDRICVTRDRVAAVRPLRVIHGNLKGVMYYC